MESRDKDRSASSMTSPVSEFLSPSAEPMTSSTSMTSDRSSASSKWQQQESSYGWPNRADCPSNRIHGTQNVTSTDLDLDVDSSRIHDVFGPHAGAVAACPQLLLPRLPSSVPLHQLTVLLHVCRGLPGPQEILALDIHELVLVSYCQTVTDDRVPLCLLMPNSIFATAWTRSREKNTGDSNSFKTKNVWQSPSCSPSCANAPAKLSGY